MTKTETIQFMQTIKSYYNNFLLEDYVVKEWANKLKDFNNEEVYKKLEEHLNGEFKKEPPKLHYLIDSMLKDRGIVKAAQIKVKCSLCGRTINYLDFDSHLTRHSSVYYIKSKEHYLEQHYSEEQMMKADQEHFDQFYDNFLTKLYKRIEKGDEKERIAKIIFD